jgi:hypothetical protein
VTSGSVTARLLHPRFQKLVTDIHVDHGATLIYNLKRNNRLVWDASIQIMLDLFDTMWAGQEEVVVNHSVDLTLPVRALNATSALL